MMEEQRLWTPEQRAIVKANFARGATEEDLNYLEMICKRTNLDPFRGQIRFSKRQVKDGDGWKTTWQSMTTIDGYRACAENGGRYAGQDAPTYEDNEDGTPRSATVAVWRKDFPRPIVATAFFGEYVQLTKEGQPERMWSKMPRLMLAKCAEALALRKGFPSELAGVYTQEEMGQAENPESTSQAQATTISPAPQNAPPAAEVMEGKTEATFEAKVAAKFPKAKVTTITKTDIDNLDREFEAFLKEELGVEGDELASILKTWNASPKTRERLDMAKTLLRQPVKAKQGSLAEPMPEEEQ